MYSKVEEPQERTLKSRIANSLLADLMPETMTQDSLSSNQDPKKFSASSGKPQARSFSHSLSLSTLSKAPLTSLH